MAQFGRALRSGRRGRKFKSCHLDHISFKPHCYAVCFLLYTIFTRFITKNPPTEPYQTPVRERASSPLREFSFRVPLLYLAFFDLGYKNTALLRAVKLLSLLKFVPNFTKNGCFYKVRVQIWVLLLKNAVNYNQVQSIAHGI